MARHALLRPPTHNLALGEVTHIERTSVDVDLARRQWFDYRAALERHGWTTQVVPPLDSCPDAVFIEDTAVVVGGSALACRPGADSRKPEVEAVAGALRAYGCRMGAIEAPGTLDGGDVMRVGSTLYIGLGGRTNAAGIEQARAFFEAEGATIVAVPNTKVLHLKSAVTALPDGRVIGYEPVTEDPAVFPGFIAMPDESGAHVVDLGQGRLLMAAGCPDSVELIADLGFDPIVVDIGEFEKLEGCVTCLSIRLRSSPQSTRPSTSARSRA